MNVSVDGSFSGITTTPSTTSFFHKKTGANGTLSYVLNGSKHSFDLWIASLQQEHTLEGQKHQGRYSTHFYPRSYSIGDLTLSIQCDDQQDLQDLGTFIRTHHSTVVQVGGGFSIEQPQTPTNNAQFQKLLRLVIPSEDIDYRGWCTPLPISREGTMVTVPLVDLTYTPIIDNHSPTFSLSKIIKGIYPRPSDEVGLLPAASAPPTITTVKIILNTSRPTSSNRAQVKKNT